MRVKTLRTIAITLIFVLIDVPLFGIDILPDLLGLPFLFFCSVLLTDRAGRFARPAVVSALMSFLEFIRLFNFAGSETVAVFLGYLYLFLRVLLVLTLSDGVAQFSLQEGHPDVAGYCDATGHIYALTFIITALAMFFPVLTMIFTLINYLIAAFSIVMFIYFYSSIYLTTESQASETRQTDTSHSDHEPETPGAAPVQPPPMPLPSEDKTAVL